MSGRVSFAALFLHRLADDPQVASRLEALLSRIDDVVARLIEAEQSRSAQARTVRQLIPGRMWQSDFGDDQPSDLANALQAALAEDTRPDAEGLRLLAAQLSELGIRLERQAQALASTP
jgi:hypothetical protein